MFIPDNSTRFYGDQTRWFMARVVDLQDPLELGRIRVRIFGIHTEDTSLIADEDLPWAQVVVPITQGGTAGFGNNLGIQVNANVFGVFLDGKSSQLPLILGSLPKKEDNEDDEYDSVSTSPLARGIQVKPYEPDSDIGEPADPFNAVYPKNLVFETPAGHVKEYDNTDSAERIRELHKSGTFYQVNPDGDFVEHIVKDRYTAIAGNDAIHIYGNVNVIIEKDATVTVGGDVLLKAVDGQVTIDTPQTTMTGELRVDGGVSVGNDVVTDKGISHNNHTHVDTPGLGAGTTSPPK